MFFGRPMFFPCSGQNGNPWYPFEKTFMFDAVLGPYPFQLKQLVNDSYPGSFESGAMGGVREDKVPLYIQDFGSDSVGLWVRFLKYYLSHNNYWFQIFPARIFKLWRQRPWGLSRADFSGSWRTVFSWRDNGVQVLPRLVLNPVVHWAQVCVWMHSFLVKMSQMNDLAVTGHGFGRLSSSNHLVYTAHGSYQVVGRCGQTATNITLYHAAKGAHSSQ